jgi:serine acetyltransferase
VIGANSVVRGEIPSYCVAAGNPARVVKRLNREAWRGVRGAEAPAGAPRLLVDPALPVDQL